jgi:lysyl-tRNA synthetase, class II
MAVSSLTTLISSLLTTHTPQQYYEMRSRTIQKLRETQSPNPYPHKFDVSISLTSYIDKYGQEGKIAPGKKLEGVTESLAGRIHNIRLSSQKLRFYDLHGEGKKVQIMANLRSVFAKMLLSPTCC